MKIGFVINPIAGIGGPLGLGGSDDLNDEVKHNVRPIALQRAISAIRSIESQKSIKKLHFLTCSGEMGTNAFDSEDIEYEIAYDPSKNTTAEDTINACKAFLSCGVELIIFVGGDGTAKDILSSIDRNVPILGVPSGVKMHSGAFLNKPQDAGFAVEIFFETRSTTDADVMDVDENAARRGKVSARLFGTALVPEISDMIQPSKSPSTAISNADELEEIAEYFYQNVSSDTLYILGTGSTISALARKLGLEKNELTVSAILSGREIGRFLDEKGVLQLLKKHPKTMIVVTPIGGQGFVFGRGNQQISAEVISHVTRDRIIIVATPSKLRNIRVLRTDTGNSIIDEQLKGYWKVLVGFGKYRAILLE